jgi:hypothetical protein
MKYFIKTYYGGKLTTRLDGIMETLRLNLENRFKIVVTPNKLENILCKTFRFVNGETVTGWTCMSLSKTFFDLKVTRWRF